MHLYTYNEKKHTLHILGGCPSWKSPDYIGFDTEEEAVKYGGRALGMCMTCAAKRDQLLKDILLKKER